MKMLSDSKFWLIVLLILAAAVIRLINNEWHWWNFSPIGAMALFSGSRFRNPWIAFSVPLLCMLVTDAFIGFHSGMPVVYSALLAIILIGRIFLSNLSAPGIILSSIGASVSFFLITNFAFFYPTVLYPHSWEGIVSSYAAGLPFFQNTLLSDLTFSGILFGGYFLLSGLFSFRTEKV